MMKTPTRTVVKAALKSRPKRPLSTRAMTGASVALFALTFAPLLAPPKPYELQELRSLLSGESAALTYAPSGPVELTEDSERPVAERHVNRRAAKAEIAPRDTAQVTEAVARDGDEPAQVTDAALTEAPALAGVERQTTERQAERASQEPRRAQERVEREPAPIEVEAEPLEELDEPVLPEQTDADNED
jgi:hypothetical protein